MKTLLSYASVPLLRKPGSAANLGPNRAANRVLHHAITSPPNAQACPLCLANDVSIVLAENQHTLNKCLRCGVMYVHPHPAPHQLTDFFGSEYIASEEDVEVRFGTRPFKCLRAVATFINERKTQGNILDVGCAGGHFLDGFFSGSSWQKWGIELSRFAANRAARKSIQVHIGDIHSAVLPRQSFDVIAVLDTFYYFLQPQRELAVIRQSLKPDGLLVIAAPSAAVHIWRNTGWRSRLSPSTGASLFDTHHLFFYSPQSLQHLLGQCGFETIAVLPLPAIGQRTRWRNWLAQGYYAVSAAAWKLDLFNEMPAPRFLLAAKPA